MTVETMEWIADTENAKIRLNSDYVGNYSGDVRFEVTGIIYHETTHVWQWNRNNHDAPDRLIEGIADYIRLKAGLAPPHWVKKGSGKKWDEGYTVTAYFLDYCDELKSGFVAFLNCLMKDNYSGEYFVQLLGKTMDELWMDYKNKYGSL
ncbi:Basic secretory protease [Thalictrum thalictroides]|uniref:Basic secretory protease n=1 Tax=Thalictrum thalictroides TaxID=46969 RepID=A0A7J6VTH0_THATH|nr:Basic secretory protease [Thalictrum thalictroides]